MARYSVNRRSDRRRFKHTADVTKRINVQPILMRGGIRL